MDAFHSLWSKPSGQSVYRPEGFEILTAALSALKWRHTNGKISMVCDLSVADFLYSSGLDFLWDEIITELDSIPHSIDEKTYWAAGKLFALARFNAPIVGIDTDFIVWEKLDFKDFLYVIHREELDENAYPDLPEFIDFAPHLDFLEKPSNTAFFYIGDDEFLKLYTSTAIDFMKTHTPDSVSLPHMLFAEQRLFSMCAAQLGLKINSLSSLRDLFSKKNRTFTHLWGYKELLRKNPDLKKSYCENIIKRLCSDFPSVSSQPFERLL